jgi:hypothetical protein
MIRPAKPRLVSEADRNRLIQEALDCAMNPGRTVRDEILLGTIEALLRDALGHDHGVWNWRVDGLRQAIEFRRRKAAEAGKKLSATKGGPYHERPKRTSNG